MKKYASAVAFAAVLLLTTSSGRAQHLSLGGNTGILMLDRSVGFHFAPAVELLLNRNIGLGSEFSFNSQYGAPILWHPYFKYYIQIRESHLMPYASAGPLLAMNVPNGPCFGFLFGGGLNIPVAHNLFLAPDFLIGPIFNYAGGTYPFILRGYYWGYETYGLSTFKIPGVTILAFSVRGGIRYEI
jgi:hypothetical protein